MANQLKMATIDTILTLHRRRWSIRRIALALGVHRDTVSRHLRQANQAGAPAGSDPGKLGQAPTGSAGGPAPAEAAPASQQPSLCEPWRAVVLVMLESGLSAQRTRPAMPRHKGKVESGVGYVKDNALKGRVFPSLEAKNQHLLAWEATVADTRIHGTTRQQVGKHFAQVEHPALQPLPRERFPGFHEAVRTVHRDGHVEVSRAYYSVPPEYLGRRVWVRWDGRLVRVFNERMEQIAVHPQHERGRFSTQAKHIAAEKISNCERGAAWLLGQVRRLGQQSTRWAEALIETRGVEGVRVLQGLLALSKRHPVDAIEQACGVAASYGSYRLRTIRTLIARHAPAQEQFPFMTEHPLIRPLTEYTRFVHTAFQKEVPG